MVEEKIETKSFMNATFKFSYVISSVIIVAILMFAVGYFLAQSNQENLNKATDKATEKVLSKDEITAKAIDYINRNFAANGLTFKLRDVTEEGSSLYNLTLEIYNENKLLQVTNVYVTTDGKNLLLGNLLDLSKDIPKQEPPKFEPEKTEKPDVLLFTMSFCPYGNQAENGMMPAVDLLKATINFEPHYIVDATVNENPACLKLGEKYYCSLHGNQELNQDIRELCVFKYDKEKYWQFVNLVNKNCNAQNADTCWEAQAVAVGLNVNKINDCYNTEAAQLLDAEIQFTEKYNVSASPTLIVNGSTYNSDRSPDAYKNAICTAFLKAPNECSQNLGAGTVQAAGSC